MTASFRHRGGGRSAVYRMSEAALCQIAEGARLSWAAEHYSYPADLGELDGQQAAANNGHGNCLQSCVQWPSASQLSAA
jgi:hypothetical protein